ncbi:MAG: AzlC family ABC transporter permease [Alphaproteobacteria bacterium]
MTETRQDKPANGWGSPRGAFFGGARDAIGVPVLGLSASYIGYGALARENGFDIWVTLFSSIAIWAAPAQVLMVEMHSAGASLVLIVIGAAAVNMRFLPMSAALMPHLAAGEPRRWRLFAAAYYIAILSWAYAMRRTPGLPGDERVPYFLGFAYTVLGFGVPATWLGHMMTGDLPPAVTLGFVALTPIFFGLVFIDSVTDRPGRLALAIGAALGPPCFLLSPEWSVILVGLIGGTAAFLTDRVLPVSKS